MGWVSPSIPEDISKLLTSPSLPGQESGNGLVDILYGSTSPGGKLPYTIAKREADYGTAVVSGNDDYPEGLYIDYRHFDKEGIAPRYEFGFGLCMSMLPLGKRTPANKPKAYTTFSYSGLTTSYTDKTAGSTAPGPGGAVGLFDTVATVTAKITNNGTVTGAEVAQLYIGLPSSAPASPPKQLRGF
jgi:beta-glucosidase